MSFIERLAKKRVGFSCWKLFIVDYFRCYGVCNFKNDIFLVILKKILFSDCNYTIKNIHQVESI